MAALSAFDQNVMRNGTSLTTFLSKRIFSEMRHLLKSYHSSIYICLLWGQQTEYLSLHGDKSLSAICAAFLGYWEWDEVWQMDRCAHLGYTKNWEQVSAP